MKSATSPPATCVNWTMLLTLSWGHASHSLVAGRHATSWATMFPATSTFTTKVSTLPCPPHPPTPCTTSLFSPFYIRIETSSNPVCFGRYPGQTYLCRNVCGKVVGERRARLSQLCECHVVRKARVIVDDNSHVLPKYYELLPSGRWFRILKSNTAVSSVFEQINPYKHQSWCITAIHPY